MKAADWLRVRELFERALDEEPRDLQGWVEREAGGDRSVAAEVLSLLEHHSQAGAFLTGPPSPALLEDDEAVLPDGHTVGQYVVVREIGRGGMGRVYLARDTRLGRKVALKALLPQLTRDPRHRERLRREARAAAALTHPGICTIYALEEHDGELFIAAEYVDGCTLRDELDAGVRPAVADVQRTAYEIAAALAAAHERGITHRDLKPENVMRTRDGRIKILDFGLARIEPSAGEPAGRSVTAPGILVGTPAYMAPEQLKGGPLDARTDVFALGVLLYEYACGSHPFAAPTALAVAARILENNPVPVEASCPGLPPPLAAAIERCLRKSPADRFASAADVRDALRHSDLYPRRHVARWWRTHQVTAIGMYLVAATAAWQIKEWDGRAAALFGVISVAATIAGVFRGHLLFTERQIPTAFPAHRRPADVVTLVADLVIAAALVVDAGLIGASRQLAGVLTVALAIGIALARLVMERATATAAFD